MRTIPPCALVGGLALLLPGAAHATQGHGGIEGVYVHQLAHIFFIFSMGVLIYWLRERKLTAEAGWRYIQYAALFLILWNLDAVLVHALDEQFEWVRVTRLDLGRILILPRKDTPSLSTLYYLAKFDHLLCVPALVFLYMGLKRLLRVTPQIEGKKAS